MIIIKTTLRKIPIKCSKCRFSILKNDFKDKESPRCCILTGTEAPYFYNKNSNNYEYGRSANCPLIQIDNIK